jgi:hypothetical protein
MAIKINDDLMTLEINGTVIATARRRPGGWWEITNWPRFLDRNHGPDDCGGNKGILIIEVPADATAWLPQSEIHRRMRAAGLAARPGPCRCWPGRQPPGEPAQAAVTGREGLRG